MFERVYHWTIFGCAWLFLLLSVVPLWAIDNREVIQLLEAEISEETIILAVERAETVDFQRDAKALVQLKEAGASEALLQAILTRAGERAATPVPSSPVAPKKPVVTEPTRTAPDAQVLPPRVVPRVGDGYFTRYTLKYEGTKWPATNYWRGAILPINSEVELVRMSGKYVTLRLIKTNEVVKFENIKKYTGQRLEDFAADLISKVPTKIELYGEPMANDIRNGAMRLGMTKTQLLLTRGFPPKHETASTELDRWVYWSSRFVKRTFVFEGDRLIQARGIY